MNKECFVCSADLSPWEGDVCISCSPDSRWVWNLSNSERALQVLESEDGPISVYDVYRSIKRKFGGDPSEYSINTSLASDPRFCWGGRGVYGLYRHGLLPGPRNLAGVAKFLIYSARAPINMRILSFLMQFMGYRFHPQSLTNALSRDPNVANLGWQGYDVERSDAAAIALNLDLWFAPSMPAFHNLVERCRRDLVEGIKEYQRRTSRA